MRKTIASERRRASIDEAINWPAGRDLDNRVFHTIFSYKGYKVCLGKPGKETRRSRRTNVNDMLPSVFKGNQQMPGGWGFAEIWGYMEQMKVGGNETLQLIGCLLVRSAFMFDHVEQSVGCWRYAPPENIVSYIETKVPVTPGLPFRVFLHLLEALALNEDVKYYTLRGEVSDRGVGRPNNLLTYVRFLLIPLGIVPILEFVADCLRGVAPITLRDAKGYFFPIQTEDGNLSLPPIPVSASS